MVVDQLKQVWVKDREELITSWSKQGLVVYEEGRMRLTGEGMDLYNTLITDLLETI